MVTYGEGCVLGVSYGPIPRGDAPENPKFLGTILMLDQMTKVGMVTYVRDGRFTQCHCTSHKCVARFFSDSPVFTAYIMFVDRDVLTTGDVGTCGLSWTSR